MNVDKKKKKEYGNYCINVFYYVYLKEKYLLKCDETISHF